MFPKQSFYILIFKEIEKNKTNNQNKIYTLRNNLNIKESCQL